MKFFCETASSASLLQETHDSIQLRIFRDSKHNFFSSDAWGFIIFDANADRKLSLRMEVEMMGSDTFIIFLYVSNRRRDSDECNDEVDVSIVDKT